MEVMCIDNTAKGHKDSIGDFLPKEGGIYTVLEIVNWYGYDWYLLAEDDGGNGWNPIFFIPLSNVTEKKIYYETETV